MSLQRKVGFWLTAAAALILFVYVLADVLMPFVAGLVLAYLLDPLATRLERLGLGRLGASLLILIFFVILFIGVLSIVVPFFASQLLSLIERLPGYVGRLQQVLTEHGQPILERIGGQQALADIQNSLKAVLGQGVGVAGRFINSLWSGGQALLGVISLLVITPVVAFYLLLDWPKMIETVDGWVPVSQRETVRGLASEMDGAVSGFLRGQSLVCLILGCYYAAGLAMLGLNFGVLIGMIIGLLSFIPYVGTMIGLMLAIGVAVAQFWPEWTMILAVIGVFALGQFLEGNIIYPKLVGESVGLHPVWLMFALIAFGSLFGFVGLLLAVPLAASAAVILRFFMGKYLDSSLHGGTALVAAAKVPSGKTDA
jgi:predicted PurR-regulated permease PerM